MTMDRDEAIATMLYNAQRASLPLYAPRARELREKAVEALIALGVTEDEVTEALAKAAKR